MPFPEYRSWSRQSGAPAPRVGGAASLGFQPCFFNITVPGTNSPLNGRLTADRHHRLEPIEVLANLYKLGSC
jgi:hypothetical protein